MGATVLRLLLSSLSGLGMALVCPPIGLRHLLWVVFLPMLLAQTADAHRQNMWIGYAAGWMMLFVNFFWLADTVGTFSSIPYLVSVLVVVLFATIFALPYLLVFGTVRWLRQRLGLGWLLVFPALQIAHETFAPALFPYALGATLYRDPAVWQVASVLGASSLSGLVLFVNAVIAESVWRFREKAPVAVVPLLSAALLLVLAFGFGTWRHAQVEASLAQAPTIRAAILQHSESMETRLSKSVWEELQDWTRLTGQVLGDEPDLVVWPEGSVLFNPDDERPFPPLGHRSPKEFFGTMAERGGYDFLIGGGTVDIHDETTADGRQSYTAYNSCYTFDRAGDVTGRYDKVVPLPFGEYLPLADTFPFLRDLIQGPGNFRAGTEVVYFNGATRDGSLQFDYTSPICYEAILSSQMWAMRNADLFVNITNDSWFGDTAGPHLHGMLSAVRAMELGRPLLRIAYTGVSFVVEPHGAILYETEPFVEVAKVEEVRMAQVETIYRRGGWLFPWLASICGLFCFVVAYRRKVS